jgi:hypothetical protein
LVEGAGEAREGVGDLGVADADGGVAGGEVFGDGGGDLFGLVDDALALGDPGHAHGVEELGEGGAAVVGAFLGGEVGAAVEGLEGVGLEEDAHGPAAVTGHGDGGGHVEFVEVGSFLAIDLDGEEVAVEEGGDAFVLEGLAFHDVAPVAGGVADREEDGHVAAAGLGEGLGAPRPPIDGVGGVLQEVGAGLRGEAAWHEGQRYG